MACSRFILASIILSFYDLRYKDGAVRSRSLSAAKIGIIFRTAKFYAAFWLPKKNLAGGVPGEVDVETGDFKSKDSFHDPN